MEYVNVHRKDGTIDEIPVYDWDEAPLEDLSSSVLISAKDQGHDKIGYLTTFATFDIETTTIPGKKHKKAVKHKDGSVTMETVWDEEPWAFMYQWQVCIGGICVFGRRWEEFFDLLERIRDLWRLKDKKRLVIYVHNLGFELAFLYPFFFQRYGRDAVKIFATDAHTPVYVLLPDGFEFRCSWKMTNMSLYMFTHTELGSPYEKAWGDLDYKEVRTANSALTPTEKEYCLLDVLALWCALSSKMHADKDTIASVPITSTGYPRRVCRRACRKWPKYREQYFNPNKLTTAIYALLKELRRGGNTHADRHQVSRILQCVMSYDYVSEYPAAMLLYGYPMEAFKPYGKPGTREEMERVFASGRAVIGRITIIAPRVKEDVPVPYIPIDKIWRKHGKIQGDNGRILSCDGYVSITINEVDWVIISKQYDFDGILCEGLWTARKAPLPEPIRETILFFFAQKCDLKEEIEKAKKDLANNPGEKIDLIDRVNALEYRLGKVKNMLNGIFGMMYTDPVHLECTLDDAGEWLEELPEGQTEESLLKKYNVSPNSFLVYAWGVWVTSYGRMMLDKLQDCARDPASGRHVTAYSDTDSAKSAIWDEGKLNDLVEEQKALAREKGALYVSRSGKEYLMGYPELDSIATRFITLGAKKYAYETENGTLKVTVSGVSNVHAPGDKLGRGARELMEHGGLEAFKVGFVFRDAGGRTVWYGHKDPCRVKVKGVIMTTASYCAMTDGEYTLGQSAEYKKLLGSL